MKIASLNDRVAAVVKSFPACDIVELAIPAGGVLELKAGDELALKTDNARTCWLRHYSISSVVSYSMESGRDPIQAVERSKAKGDPLHWINGIGAMLTAHEREREAYIEVSVGQIIKFEGLKFEIIAAPNSNLSLEPVNPA